MKSMKSLIAAVSFIAAAAALNATPINYLASADGSAATADYSFSATGGSLQTGTKNGVTFLGVSGGETKPEIDGGQSLTVWFTEPQRLASLTLVLLFNGPEYGDTGEIAAAFTSGGDLYELRVIGENDGEWYRNNVKVADLTTDAGNANNTQLGKAGKWTVLNPFGYSTVDSFTLYPIDNTPAGDDGSDFGLFAFSTVPDAGSTLALMGVALIGLAGFARRSRR
ncbi:MAG TPA: VPDSG-CTERM sorting domain-containing protein [Bacteroidia bacterium]|nr:VPDSG-CTERM sorting domain-containing protein [Bacteroidia bacterium]